MLFPTIHPVSGCMGDLSLALGTSPPPPLLPRGSPWALPFHSRMSTRQSWGCFLSHHQEKLHSLTGSPSVPGIPASCQFDPFLQLGLLALHAWTVTTWISLSYSLLSWAVITHTHSPMQSFQTPPYAFCSQFPFTKRLALSHIVLFPLPPS